MKFLRYLSLSLLLCCLATTLAGAVEIIYPADKTSVSRSNFLILRGGTFPAAEALIVEINGTVEDPIDISSPEYKQAFGDFLILEPEWTAGRNLVVVTALVGGKAIATERAEFFYQPDFSYVIPPGYRPFVMHLPEKEKVCTPCHKLDSPAKSAAGGSQGESPCSSCHRRMMNKEHVHGPIGSFSCEDCHERNDKRAATGVSRYALPGKGFGLCSGCHDDMIDLFTKKPYVHGPVSVGMCEACHDPHASDQPKQLRQPVNELCYSCHASLKGRPHAVTGTRNPTGHPMSGKRDPLRPERPFSCVSCHDPHGEGGPTFLVGGAKSGFGVCSKCHIK